jgi:hypothetical protein
MKTGYLALSIYISDINQLGKPIYDDTQIEISSSGTYDKNELNWGWTHLNLKTGWNELTLPFSAAKLEGGQIDLSRINYFRFFSHRFVGSPLVVKIDNIRFLSYGN